MTRLCASSLVKFVAICVLALAPLGARGRGGSTPSADCYSGAGCLDPEFGTLGKVQYNIGGDAQYLYRMAIQPDGRIVVAGARWVAIGANTWDQSWVIGRFQGNGTIDASFGVGGLFTLDLIGGYSHEQPVGVAVQTDGKIVVGGYAINGGGGSTSSTVLIRLTGSGSFDPAFGTAGKVVRTVANGSGGAMALQPDGKIVLVRNEGSPGARVTRFKTNGAIDNQFGSQGFRLVAGMTANAIALQSSGKIVVAGSKSSVGDAMLARLTSAGSLDSSFGSSGSKVVSFTSGGDAFLDMTIASDDSIVAGGHANFITTVTANLAIARVTPNGAMATGFGSSGTFMLDVHGFWDAVRAVSVRADGRVEFVGWAGFSGPGGAPHNGRNVLVGRLSTAGLLDSSFGSGGMTETDFGATSLGLAGAVGPDGLLTIAGSLLNGEGTGSVLWAFSRYFR